MGCGPTQTTVVGAQAWKAGVYTSTGPTDAVNVAVANANRRSLLVVLTKTSAGTGRVVTKSNYSDDASYPLETNGEGVTINTSGEVWFVADTSAGATVKVIEELDAANG